MKSYIFGILGFAAGVGAGIFTGKLLYEKKYAALAQEEIDSVKEAFKISQEAKRPTRNKPEVDHLKDKPTLGEMKEYVRTIEEQGYAPKPKVPDTPIHEVISPEEYEEEADGFDSESLTLYYDGILVDEANKRLSDNEIEEMIGKESLNHFGEYEDDAVYIRNNTSKVKYEVVRDERNYTDTLNG